MALILMLGSQIHLDRRKSQTTMSTAEEKNPETDTGTDIWASYQQCMLASIEKYDEALLDELYQ